MVAPTKLFDRKVLQFELTLPHQNASKSLPATTSVARPLVTQQNRYDAWQSPKSVR